MNEDIQEKIKEIKSKFRLFMNGPVSQSMREKGLDYKWNFGIEFPRIKEIASAYPHKNDSERLRGKPRAGSGFVERTGQGM